MKRRNESFVAMLLGLLALLVVPSRSFALAPSAIPAQWIAKQYTELLGRLPETDEWNDAVADLAAAAQCNAASLAILGKDLARSFEFRQAYPEASAKVGRFIALVRAVYNHDPNMNDWNAYFVPYRDGIKTWDQLVDEIFGNGIFAAFVVPGVCSTSSASNGFGYQRPLDIRDLTGGGVSRTRGQLQAELNVAAPGSTVYLEPYEVIRINGQGLTVRPGVTLATRTLPSTGQYASMGRIVRDGSVCLSFFCSNAALVNLEPGAELRRVWVDGHGPDPASYGYKIANVETLGSDAVNMTKVLDNHISNPGRDGVGIRARGFGTSGIPCTNQQISRNVVTGYSSNHAPDRFGQARWVDGISVFCESTIVTDNEIVDASDSGIVIYGAIYPPPNRGEVSDDELPPSQVVAQRSLVRDNLVLSAGIDGRTALGADAVGPCRAVRNGLFIPCVDLPHERSFEGASVRDNVFWTGPRTSFDIGLMIGGKQWWGEHASHGRDDNAEPYANGRGVSFTDNTVDTASARVGMGISVMGMYETTLTGNTSTYTLVDPNPGVTHAKCPLANVNVGSARYASIQPGGQAATTDDSSFSCLLSSPPAGGLEFITVGAGGNTFVGATSGKRFNPWALNLDTNWFTDWESGLEDFREMKRVGANGVRLLLQFHHFVNPPSPGHPNGTPNISALALLAHVISMAEQTGLYLDLTGLGIQAPADNVGTWYDQLDESGRWAAQKVFWKNVAFIAKNSPAVLFYDLMNEPVVPLDPSGLAPPPKPGNPLYCPGSLDSCYVQWLTLDRAGRHPKDIVRAWISEMNDAIRNQAGDTQHMTTIGQLHWLRGSHTGFDPIDFGDLVSFISVHRSASDPQGNPQPSIDNVRSFKIPGKPLVIEEWFTLSCNGTCNDAFLLGVQPEVTGWFGFYNRLTPAQQTPPAFIPPEWVFRQNTYTFMRTMELVSPMGLGTLQP